jgi:hypothetical protein
VEVLMTTTHTETVADRIEAEARKTMAQLARMPDRGYDSHKAIEDERAFLDGLLDQYNALGT